MEDGRVFALGTLALAAAYVLIGGWLAARWGVDPSRETPGANARPSGARRVPGALAVIGHAAIHLWMAFWMFVGLREWMGETVGTVISVLGVSLCGALSFAALFVSVRHETDLARVAEEELFPAAGKLMYALEALTVIPFSGLPVTGKLLFVDHRVFCLTVCGVWLAVGMMSASVQLAKAVGSERHMRPATYGSAACAGILWLGAFAAKPDDRVVTVAALALWAVVWLTAVSLGGHALCGLLQSERPGKKRVPRLVFTLMSAAAGLAIGVLAGEYALLLCGAAGAAWALLAVAVCARWLERIGRGLFLRR